VLDALWQKDEFLTLLLQRLVQYGITANQLQLAFTMDKFDQFDGQLVEKLKELSEAGFQMTLTGLGATPLNLPVLSGLNVQEFKFDQAWLKTQMASAAGRKWIQALIQMGQGLDACMIATGLDEESEAVALKQWGCSLGQGPYWTQPIDAQSFEQLLT
jgi:EAL domain-containing protein (putative c-di-GMP-specific phosphodiesterase class I)